MTAGLPDFLTWAVPPVLAAWLQRLLVPVAQASMPVGLEIRPTVRLGVWARDSERAPDGRVVPCSHVSFWAAEKIVSVYLHECAHRLPSVP